MFENAFLPPGKDDMQFVVEVSLFSLIMTFVALFGRVISLSLAPFLISVGKKCFINVLVICM